MIFSTAIASNVDLGETQAKAFQQIRFRLSGVDLSGFQLDGGRQSLEGDVLTVRREDWDALGMEATPIAYLTRDEINALTGFLRYWRGAEIEGFDFTSPSPSITFEDYRT